MSRGRTGWRAAGWVLAVVLVATSCSEPAGTGRVSTAIGRATPTGTPVPARPPDLREHGPGTLVGVEPMPQVAAEIADRGAAAYRIVYRSTGARGESTLVSGTLVEPSGLPPDGGWPLISYAHGTTGVREHCAPSGDPTLRGNAVSVAALLDAGFAVVMSDYQGIGVAGGYSPYLDARSLGANVIDAVRAARHADRRLAKRWAALGGSLGGLAAWAAADLAPTYGRGLEMVGAAAAAPVADMTGLADAAARGRLARAQLLVFVYTLQGFAGTYPELDLDDYRSDAARRLWPRLLRCDPDAFTLMQRSLRALRAADLRPATAAARDRLAAALAATAVPVAETPVPLLVLYGSVDRLVPRSWTARALVRACAAGGTVEHHRREGEGHEVDGTMMLPWLQARFDGQRPLNTCGLPR